MTDQWGGSEDDVSLLAIGATLLRHRMRIVRWMIVGAVIATVVALLTPAKYVASASFVPQSQSNDAARSGLASLAGQFGVALPTGNQAASPDFYASLLRSRVLLENIARDTFTVSEMDGKRVAMVDLLDVGGAGRVREGRAKEKLAKIVGPSVVRTTGVVQLTVATEWPSVSLAIAQKLLMAVDDFNQRSRQGQASAERKFVEQRLAAATIDLRVAEDSMEKFRRSNRSWRGSPELEMLNDRLDRNVMFRQQIVTSLAQSYEEARSREVRDTPVISIVEPAAVPATPAPRGRIKMLLLGIVLGGFLASLLVLVSDTLARQRARGGADAVSFFTAIADAKNDIGRRLRLAGGGPRPPSS